MPPETASSATCHYCYKPIQDLKYVIKDYDGYVCGEICEKCLDTKVKEGKMNDPRPKPKPKTEEHLGFLNQIEI